MKTKPNIHQVLKANPYCSNTLGSLGNAENMLLRQYKFPDEYDIDEDILISAYHDRCFQWDHNHATKACKKAFNNGELRIESWVESANPKDVMDFLIDILKVDTNIKWTGCRVLGTVHRSNGYPIFTLELFCNKSNTETHSLMPAYEYFL